MKRTHGFGRAALLAASLAIATAPAQASLSTDAPAPLCIPRQDMKAIMGFALPLLIDGAAMACRAMLPSDAFLTRSGPGLAERYRREGGGWDAAQGPIERAFVGKLPKGMGSHTLEALVGSTVKGMVADKIKPRDCATASHVAEILSPLPADNMSELAVLLIDLGTRGDKAKGRTPYLSICPMSGGAR